MAKDEEKKGLTSKQIQAHNAAIDSQIAELKAEKQKYIDARDVAKGIKKLSEDLSTNAVDVNTLLKQIKINHKAVGDGYFKDNVKSRIDSYSQEFASIITQCNNKIDELDGEIKNLKLQYLYSNVNTTNNITE